MMPPRMMICWVVMLCGVANLPICSADIKARKAVLCDLQTSIKAGETRSVRVDGIYSDGFEMGVLTNARCPSERTWVELDLRSLVNNELLKSSLDSKGYANVTLEGEFFGPPIPDQKLPEQIRRSYHPGWGHLGAFNTKLVVHFIRSVN
jgi:hypothetical protein